MRHTLSKTNKTPFLIPLVLHKVVQTTAHDWEDVHENNISKMLDVIGDRWAVFGTDDSWKQSRWLLTFDDGNESDYSIVFPLLLEKNIRATFFLVTDKIGAPGYLDWSQVKEMHRHGMCIGSHSCSHRSMVDMPMSDAAREFVESKELLEDFLGDSVEAFSYPFGRCTQQLHQLGKDLGYRYLCTSDHGYARSSDFVVPRNSINSMMGFGEILNTMNPTKLRCLRWLFEDKVKCAAKFALGADCYMRMRSKLLKK